jgi:DNA polymerase-3 subunit gamma/tau
VSGIYTVLARKWRPLLFDDVVGQDVVVQTLKNAIQHDRVAHAYLFNGSRGTGKTTVARILARALNCENGPAPDPCGTCGTCTQILQGTSLDVLEIDGASTRGIDDVRRLREDVKLSPTGGRKKVYIIDEVHMLTSQAFNALLKTLEEPPPHVVFVLATTDPQKMPDTILSRCQRFNFTRIRPDDAVARLREVVDGENVNMSDDALRLLARRSGGALRDALGFLDQVLATGADPIDTSTVENTLGLVGGENYAELVSALVGRDPGRALAHVGEVHRAGHDVEFFVQGLLDLLRNMMIVKSVRDGGDILDLSTEEMARLEALAEPIELGDALRLIRMTVEIADSLRTSEYPWVHLEIGVVEMASLDRVAEIGALISAMQAGGPPDPGGQARRAPSPAPKSAPKPGAAPSTSGRGSSGGSSGTIARAMAPSKAASSPEPEPTSVSEPVAAEAAPAPVSNPTPDIKLVPSESPAPDRTEPFALPNEVWTAALDQLKDRKPLLWSILSQGDLGPVSGGKLPFLLDAKHGFHLEQLREPAHVKLIEDCLLGVYDRPLTFCVKVEEGAGAIAREETERKKVLEDPFVKKLLEHLDGEIL